MPVRLVDHAENTAAYDIDLVFEPSALQLAQRYIKGFSDNIRHRSRGIGL